MGRASRSLERAILTVAVVSAAWLPCGATAQRPGGDALAHAPRATIERRHTGRIAGRITDTSGAALPGVTLLISGDRLREPRTVTTDEGGRFVVTGLPPGRISVTCRAPGFVQWRREDIEVAPRGEAILNVTMRRATGGAAVEEEPRRMEPTSRPGAGAAEPKPGPTSPDVAAPPDNRVPPRPPMSPAGPPPEPSQPSVPASDAPPPAAHRLLDEIERYIEQLDPGSIAFNAPEQMQIGQTTEMRLLLSPTMSVNALQDALRDMPGTVVGEVVKIAPRMEAVLTGHNFEVDSITPPLQAVSRSTPTEWRWQVTAKSSGSQRLHLTLNVSIEGTSRMLRTFDRTILVNVAWGQRFSAFLGDNWKWLVTTAFVPLGGWFWRRRSATRRVVQEVR